MALHKEGSTETYRLMKKGPKERVRPQNWPPKEPLWKKAKASNGIVMKLAAVGCVRLNPCVHLPVGSSVGPASLHHAASLLWGGAYEVLLSVQVTRGIKLEDTMREQEHTCAYTQLSSWTLPQSEACLFIILCLLRNHFPRCTLAAVWFSGSLSFQ